MGRLDDRLNESGIHDRLNEIRLRLDGWGKKPRSAADKAEPTGTLDRLDVALDWVEALVAASDPRLVTQGMLNNIGGQLSQIEASVGALVENDDHTQLDSLDSNIEDLLSGASAWPSAALFSDQDLRKLGKTFGRASEEKLGSLDHEAKELRERFEKIEDAAEEKRQQLEDRQGEIETAIQAQQAQVDQLIATSEQQFATGEQKRKEVFEAFQDEIREAAEAQRQKMTERLDTAEEQLRERIEEIFESIEAKRDEAAGLVDLVATSATAGAFGKEADKQKEEADQWRGNAIKIVGAAALIGLFALAYAIFVKTSTTLIVTKLALTAVLTGVAGYAARQSAQHRKREIRARRLFLELTAFGPFTEPLDEGERDKARSSFIERLFVGDPQVSDAEAGLSKEDINLFTQIAAVVKDLRK